MQNNSIAPIPNQDQPFWFISYSHKNSEFVEPIIHDMRRLRPNVWYDADIQNGHNFNTVIARRIKTCELFIVFLSTEYSCSAYCQDEFSFAIKHNRRIVIFKTEDNPQLEDGMDLQLVNRHMIPRMENAAAIMNYIHGYMQGDHQEQQEIIVPFEAQELFQTCMENLEHYANEAGVQNIDSDIDPKFFCPIYENERDQHEQVDLLSTITKNSQHIFVEADGGMGKTQLFFHTMKQLLDCGRSCAYLPCRSFFDNVNATFGIVLSKLNRVYFQGAAPTPEALIQHFRRFRGTPFVLFLDGFNEAVNQNDLMRDLSAHLSEMPNLQLIVSSRSSNSVLARFKHLTMQGLGTEIVSNMLMEHRHITYGQLTHNLRKLLLTPMFLKLYMNADNVNALVDTAAELMDTFRNQTMQVYIENHPEHKSRTEHVLTANFPEFVLREYDNPVFEHRLWFNTADLDNHLLSCGHEPSAIEEIRSFLINNRLIYTEHDGKRGYYRHEHFRDYWVAYALLQRVVQSKDRHNDQVPSKLVLDIFNGSYSTIIYQYFSELSEDRKPHDLLIDCLSALRSDRISEETWRNAETAAATALILKLIIQRRGSNIAGMNLDNLNLSATNLNGVQTSRKFVHSTFRGSLLTNETFLARAHESAPRRGVMTEIDGQRLLITVSDFDLIVSSVKPGSEIVLLTHLYHSMDITDKPFRVNNVKSLAAYGSLLIATDNAQQTFMWRLYKTESGQFACRQTENGNFAQRIMTSHNAARVISYGSPPRGGLAVLCTDGHIELWRLVNPNDSRTTQSQAVPIPGANLLIKPNLTFTYSPLNRAFYWAQTVDGWTTVYWTTVSSYAGSLTARTATEAFRFETGELQADLMVCDQSTDQQSGSTLMLTCASTQATVLYQLTLPTASNAVPMRRVRLDEHSELLQSENASPREQPHRVRSMVFQGGRLLACANSGTLYHFRRNDHFEYEPDIQLPQMRLSGSRFALLDIICVNTDDLVVLCVDRSLTLLGSEQLTIHHKLEGTNGGLRKLLRISDDRLLVTTYDGCVLELKQQNDRYVCINKRHFGLWCWAAAQLDPQTYAIGSYGRNGDLSVLNADADTVLDSERFSDIKIACLHVVGNVLYVAIHDNTASNKTAPTHSQVLCYQLDSDRHLTLIGALEELNGSLCYGIDSNQKHVFFTYNAANNRNTKALNRNPEVLMMTIGSNVSTAQPMIKMPHDTLYGRFNDIKCFAGASDTYLLACGPITIEGREDTSCAIIWNITDSEHIFEAGRITGLDTYATVCTAWQSGANSWRIAIITQAQTSGTLYTYSAEKQSDGTLNILPLQRFSSNRILCDAEFTGTGDVLVTSLSGQLYRHRWDTADLVSIFQNQNGLLTFSCDLSDLAEAINPDSNLGSIMADFNNTIVQVNWPFETLFGFWGG